MSEIERIRKLEKRVDCLECDIKEQCEKQQQSELKKEYDKEWLTNEIDRILIRYRDTEKPILEKLADEDALGWSNKELEFLQELKKCGGIAGWRKKYDVKARIE